MNCYSCKASISENANFCEVCGSPAQRDHKIESLEEKAEIYDAPNFTKTRVMNWVFVILLIPSLFLTLLKVSNSSSVFLSLLVIFVMGAFVGFLALSAIVLYKDELVVIFGIPILISGKMRSRLLKIAFTFNLLLCILLSFVLVSEIFSSHYANILGMLFFTVVPYGINVYALGKTIKFTKIKNA